VTETSPPALQLTVLSEPDNIAILRHGIAGVAEQLGASPDRAGLARGADARAIAQWARTEDFRLGSAQGLEVAGRSV